MFGFISDIFSSKKSSTQAVYRSDESVSASSDGQLTGVAKYLNEHSTISRGPSSVEKYLQGQAQKSGVAKYVARQAIAAKQAQVDVKGATGVAKYLADNVDAKPVKSGVSKYLATRKVTTVTSVSKYMLKQALEAKNKPAVVSSKPTGVARYLESRPKHTTSSVAKYLAKQASAAKQVAAEAINEVADPVVALTGVEKYLSQQAR
ncbi:MAG: hypothetical protein IBX55_08605 [Methyloprofundus sp.]|nr:hypothetical protein [Methyloprofundus sp.]